MWAVKRFVNVNQVNCNDPDNWYTTISQTEASCLTGGIYCSTAPQNPANLTTLMIYMDVGAPLITFPLTIPVVVGQSTFFPLTSPYLVGVWQIGLNVTDPVATYEFQVSEFTFPITINPWDSSIPVNILRIGS